MIVRDLYEILEIDRDASQSEIKRQYRLLAKKHHPDLNPDDDTAQEKLKEINLAYEVLGDPDRRVQYDTYGDAIFEGAQSGADFGGFGDFFSDLFRGFGFDFAGSGAGGMGNTPRRGQDIRKPLSLTFREAVFGVVREISFDRMEKCPACEGTGAEKGHDPETCPDCHGSGRVRRVQNSIFGQMMTEGICPHCEGTGKIITHKCPDCKGKKFVRVKKKMKVTIPEGVDRGMVLNLRGEGHEGEPGAPNGDLLLYLDVQEHEIFHRNDLDIEFELPIGMARAALGGEVDIPTLRGTEKYTIPAGTQGGTVFMKKGGGVTRGSRTGDLKFMVRVEIPKKLTERERELLIEFDEGETKAHEARKKSFFEKVKDFFEDERD